MALDSVEAGQAWDRAQAENTREAYAAYMALRPLPEHYGEALREVVLLDWAATQRVGTIEAHRAFIAQYAQLAPGTAGQEVEAARKELSRLEWQTRWVSLSTGGTRAQIEAFLKQRTEQFGPEDLLVVEANALLRQDDADWAIAVQNGTLSATTDYLRGHPHGGHASAAKLRQLEQRAASDNTYCVTIQFHGDLVQGSETQISARITDIFKPFGKRIVAETDCASTSRVSIRVEASGMAHGYSYWDKDRQENRQSFERGTVDGTITITVAGESATAKFAAEEGGPVLGILHIYKTSREARSASNVSLLQSANDFLRVFDGWTLAMVGPEAMIQRLVKLSLCIPGKKNWTTWNTYASYVRALASAGAPVAQAVFQHADPCFWYEPSATSPALGKLLAQHPSIGNPLQDVLVAIGTEAPEVIPQLVQEIQDRPGSTKRLETMIFALRDIEKASSQHIRDLGEIPGYREIYGLVLEGQPEVASIAMRAMCAERGGPWIEFQSRQLGRQPSFVTLRDDSCINLLEDWRAQQVALPARK